jgi:RPA family protein
VRQEGEVDIIESVSAAEENIRNHYDLDTCKRATSRKNASFYKKF